MEDEPRPSGQRRRKTTDGNLRDGRTETQQVVERRVSVRGSTDELLIIFIVSSNLSSYRGSKSPFLMSENLQVG